jgi:hypothetical protein
MLPAPARVLRGWRGVVVQSAADAVNLGFAAGVPLHSVAA